MNVLSRCTNIIPVYHGEEYIVLDGFITARAKNFYIRVVVPQSGNMEDICLQCEWRLSCLLDKCGGDLLQQDQCLEEEDMFFVAGLVSRSKRVLADIECIGWEKLVSPVDSTFSRLTFSCRDDGGRLHNLIILLGSELSFRPHCITDLPCPFDFHWTSNGSLVDIVEQFEGVLSTLQPFWNTLQTVDEQTRVIEPESPNYGGSCTRRIALATRSLTEKMNANFHLWDSSDSLVNNLEAILDLSFPQPHKTEKEDCCMTCAICYTFRLNDDLPDKFCDNERCSQPFHRSCLRETGVKDMCGRPVVCSTCNTAVSTFCAGNNVQWMLTVPLCQQTANAVFGECPVCGQRSSSWSRCIVC